MPLDECYQCMRHEICVQLLKCFKHALSVLSTLSLQTMPTHSDLMKAWSLTLATCPLAIGKAKNSAPLPLYHLHSSYFYVSSAQRLLCTSIIRSCV